MAKRGLEILQVFINLLLGHLAKEHQLSFASFVTKMSTSLFSIDLALMMQWVGTTET